jgi:ABC-type glutathione transport system ATPase component
MKRRTAATKIVRRKTKIVVMKRGRVVHSDTSYHAIHAFLRGYDPELAARIARANSGEAEAAIQRILAEVE